MSRRFKTFAEVFADEQTQLNEALNGEKNGAASDDPSVTGEGTTGEPWARIAPADRVGLALSGGGIRSATFNLGLLEALDQRGILSMVDYLSTVSGGGYIGGFWTAWRLRTLEERNGSVFPHRNSTDIKQPADPDNRERPETRHLREFSRFLMPRIGLNQPEMWFALATILGGMLPALLVTFATVAVCFYTWLIIGNFALRSNQRSAVVFVLATLVLHWLRRKKWIREKQEEEATKGHAKWKVLYWIGAFGSTALGAWLIESIPKDYSHVAKWGWIGLSHGIPSRFITYAFEPALAWLALAIAISVGWIFLEAVYRAFEVFREMYRVSKARKDGQTEVEVRKTQQDKRESIRRQRIHRASVRDQLSSRYLAWALLAASIAGVWELGFWLGNQAIERTYGAAGAIGGTGTLTAVFTGIYIWLRDWLTKSDKQSSQASIWRKSLARIKTFLPMLSASAGALFLVLFALLLIRFYGLGWNPSLLDHPPPNDHVRSSIFLWGTIAAGIIVVALRIFDPAHFGLHDFYRGRIARAFLGAAFKSGPEWAAYQSRQQSVRSSLQEVVGDRERESQEAELAAKDPSLKEEEQAQLLCNAHRRKLQGNYLTNLIARNGRLERAQPSAIDNRFTTERSEDDVILTNLPARRSDVTDTKIESLIRLRLRPIHILCCAANHLTGDALSTLSRGGRSAVLSQRGVSLGDDCCPPRIFEPALMLSAAQTASAAAFNSQMGEKSLRLGPASSFLMSALNLRLGLWVLNPASERIASDLIVYEGLCLRPLLKKQIGDKPWWHHPLLGSRRWLSYQIFRLRNALHESPVFHMFVDLPGKAFFRELFGRSSALAGDRAPQLHLSDGGHFENLALYELIRRHLRYIIVSDAGQDEDVAFDDLGNAIRRVREDFGVEIEIDTSPIRPDTQLKSAQHVVVGTVHYDGFEGCDKGTIIYLKPTITGDEPGDIQQYRSRNRLFPHEPTTDQFFAEAQWESYRRVGEHIGQVAFAFLALMPSSRRSHTESVFRQARAVWSRLPPDILAARCQISEKFRELELVVRNEAPLFLRRELWPEVAAYQTKPSAANAGPAETRSADEIGAVPYLVNAVQLMEEAWLMLHLDQFWSHTTNVGITNRFHRLFWMPSMRRWWIILSGICCSEFREFIKLNFDLRARDQASAGSHSHAGAAKLELRRITDLNDLKGGLAWEQMQAQVSLDAAKRTAFELLLTLEANAGNALQVGIALVHFSDKPTDSTSLHMAHWEGSHLFVPESLAGAGFKTRLLDLLIVELRKDKVQRILVTLRDQFPGRRDETARDARLNLIGFYKSRNFLVRANAVPGVLAELYLDLAVNAPSL